jgi:hypothetical protein
LLGLGQLLELFLIEEPMLIVVNRPALAAVRLVFGAGLVPIGIVRVLAVSLLNPKATFALHRNLVILKDPSSCPYPKTPLFI